jgi:hypothetical protein
MGSWYNAGDIPSKQDGMTYPFWRKGKYMYLRPYPCGGARGPVNVCQDCQSACSHRVELRLAAGVLQRRRYGDGRNSRVACLLKRIRMKGPASARTSIPAVITASCFCKAADRPIF